MGTTRLLKGLSWWVLVPTVTDDRNWSSKAAVTVWALKGLTQVAKTRLSLFALLALLLLLENLVAIMSSHSFFDLGSPGSSILGNLFPGFRWNVTLLQCNFERVFIALPWSTSGALAMTQFSKENSLWQAIVRHASNMSGPSELLLH